MTAERKTSLGTVPLSGVFKGLLDLVLRQPSKMRSKELIVGFLGYDVPVDR